jgi:hypothetical protein
LQSRARAIVVDDTSENPATIAQVIEISPSVSGQKNGGLANGNNLSVEQVYADDPSAYTYC